MGLEVKMTASKKSTGAPLAAELLQVTPGEFKIRTSVEETDGAYSMFEFLVDPRNGVPKHIHKNEDEHFIILEGSLHIAVGTRYWTLQPAHQSRSRGASRTPGAIWRKLPSECSQSIRLGTSRYFLRQSPPGGAMMSSRPSLKSSALSVLVQHCVKAFTVSFRPVLNRE